MKLIGEINGKLGTLNPLFLLVAILDALKTSQSSRF
jgi:hypothetical protein